MFNCKNEKEIHRGIQEFRGQTDYGTRISVYTEAARNLGINATMLGRWKREVEGGGNGRPYSANGKDVQAELTRLRKENHRLKIEREILKKREVSGEIRSLSKESTVSDYTRE